MSANQLLSKASTRPRAGPEPASRLDLGRAVGVSRRRSRVGLIDEATDEGKARLRVPNRNVLEAEWPGISSQAQGVQLAGPVDAPAPWLVAAGHVRNVHVTNEMARSPDHFGGFFTHDDCVLHVVEQSDRGMVDGTNHFQAF